MYLTYQPEGSEEPQRFWYQPQKLLSVERELIETLTGRDYTDFSKDVLNGNDKCRRALLFIFLKRSHVTLKFADVRVDDLEELTLEMSKPELGQIRDKLPEKYEGQELADLQAGFDRQIDEALDPPEGWSGKVLPPIVA